MLAALYTHTGSGMYACCTVQTQGVVCMLAALYTHREWYVCLLHCTHTGSGMYACCTVHTQRVVCMLAALYTHTQAVVINRPVCNLQCAVLQPSRLTSNLVVIRPSLGNWGHATRSAVLPTADDQSDSFFDEAGIIISEACDDVGIAADPLKRKANSAFHPCGAYVNRAPALE